MIRVVYWVNKLSEVSVTKTNFFRHHFIYNFPQIIFVQVCSVLERNLTH